MSQYNFTLSDSVLRRVFEFNNMNLNGREEQMILFGIRGALPGSLTHSVLDYSTHTNWSRQHILQRVAINYYYPRCIIGQWLPATGQITVFPGSTIPNLQILKLRRKRSHQFNCMQPGLYTYQKGQHPLSNSGFQPHRALRLASAIVLRRANYTIRNRQPVIDYGPTAAISVGKPGDNIHCARNNPNRTLIRSLRGQSYSHAFCMQDYYSSYGCQVIVGTPPQYIPRGQVNGNWNAWDQFIQNVYDHQGADQTEFSYLLIDSLEVQEIAEAVASNPSLFKLRFGSQGANVRELQDGLQNLRSSRTGSPYYSGTVDGDFGSGTAQSLINFQKDSYGGRVYGYANQQTLRQLRAPVSTTH